MDGGGGGGGGGGSSGKRLSEGDFEARSRGMRTKRPSTTTLMYNPNQKSLDEKLNDGTLLSRARRMGVSAAGSDGEAGGASASTRRAAFEARLKTSGETYKDPETRAMLYDAIDKSILFSGMTEAQRAMIVDVMVSVRAKRDEVIIRQGEVLEGGPGDNFYVVGAGAFHIRRRKDSQEEVTGGVHPLMQQQQNPPPAPRPRRPRAAPAAGRGAAPRDAPTASAAARRARRRGRARRLPEHGELVQERHPGDAFGELALMYNVARQASVMCMSEFATLWALPRQVYRDVTQLEALDSIESIVETLQSVELLGCLGDDQFTRLIDSFDMVAYKPHQRIIRQGEMGSAFYIILKGTVNCLSGESVVATLNRCDYFGERALLRDEPRAVHVDAVTAVTLAKITRETFHDILGPLETLMEQHFTRRVLTHVPILQHLSEADLKLVLGKFVERSYAAGDAIVTQGEIGTDFFIVKSGTVDCLVSGTKVRAYGTGEYFGERALRRDEPRAATCVATSPTVTCVTLAKDDFETLLGPLQAVLDQNMLKDTLRTAPLFRYLTSSERENVLDAFEYCEFARASSSSGRATRASPSSCCATASSRSSATARRSARSAAASTSARRRCSTASGASSTPSSRRRRASPPTSTRTPSSPSWGPSRTCCSARRSSSSGATSRSSRCSASAPSARCASCATASRAASSR